MQASEIIWSHYDTGMNARQAATMFAESREHFDDLRTAAQFQLVEGHPLAIDFAVTSGATDYRCEWDNQFGFCVIAL